MELRDLRYFVAVVDTGSVSAAAGRLGLTQPALSRQVRGLEAELGVPLFDRIGRHLRLTAEGLDLLQRSRDVLAGATSLSDRAQSLRAGEAGVLRVGASPQTLESVLARFLVGYRRAHPAVDVRLTEDGGPALLERLERGELHLALTTGDQRFASRPLFPAWVLAVMAPRHRLAPAMTVEMTALAEEPVLLLRRDFGTRQWFDGACQVAHVRPRVVLESASPHTLVAMARAGYGVAVVPSHVVLGSGVRAAPLLQNGRPFGAWMTVSWNRGRFMARYAAAFVDELVAFTGEAYPGHRFATIAPPGPSAIGAGVTPHEVPAADRGRRAAPRRPRHSPPR